MFKLAPNSTRFYAAGFMTQAFFVKRVRKFIVKIVFGAGKFIFRTESRHFPCSLAISFEMKSGGRLNEG